MSKMVMSMKRIFSKKIVKILSLALSAVLLVGATIAGTVAYLTSTKTVTNTFTYGNVSITMDEVKVDEYGKALTGNAAGRIPASAEDQSKNAYKLIPGHTYEKDTKVHVAAGSESCYLFVEIDANFAEVTNVHSVLTSNGWSPIASNSNIYCYSAIVTAGSSVVVIDDFTVNADLEQDSTNFNSLTSADFVAYAVQSDGFTSAESKTAIDAWNATFGATPPAQG